jgi:hypothetical protein
MTCRIAGAPALQQSLPLTFDTLQDVYRALAAGLIDDEQAAAADAVLRQPSRQLPLPMLLQAPKPPHIPKLRPPRPRSPNRSHSIHRRRLLASSGPLPPQLAAQFTTSEQAVLRIIGDEYNRHGMCDLPVDSIAARAGTSRTVVANTKRTARRLGLISVQERRLSYRRSDTTLIRVISKEWEAWLKHHCANTMRRAVATGLGYRNSQPTDTEVQEASPKKTAVPPVSRSASLSNFKPYQDT